MTTEKLTKLIFASANKNKQAEIREMLKNSNIELIAVEGDFNPEENGETFEGNALIKAREAAKLMGQPAIADDSGLVVDALGGRPGVHSSRYETTDEKRINKLLQELKDVELQKRSARFVCSIVIVSAKGEKLFSVTETCEGMIAFVSSGEQGFGYDPVFYLPEKNVTMAELSMEEKNKLSHRSKAFKKAVEWLGY